MSKIVSTIRAGASRQTCDELSTIELDGVAGGQQIITHLFPGGTGAKTPKFGPPVSIAAGEVNANSTDDNLPD
jgi:hypothetical protein